MGFNNFRNTPAENIRWKGKTHLQKQGSTSVEIKVKDLHKCSEEDLDLISEMAQREKERRKTVIKNG